MKHIKLLFSISLFFAYTLTIKAQSFFIDSSTSTSFWTSLDISGGSFFPGYTSETIELDSISGAEEYYSVKTVHSVISNMRLGQYNLRVKDSQVFFTGYIHSSDGISQDSIFKENYLIYDYKLKSNDTLRSSQGMACYVIDSVGIIKTLDGKSRKIQYYQNLGMCDGFPNRRIDNKPNFTIAGLGSARGLIAMWNSSNYDNNMVTVCANSNLIYFDSSFIQTWEQWLTDAAKPFGKTILEPTCSLDSFKQMVKEINYLGTEEIDWSNILVYPNPASDYIKVRFPKSIYVKKIEVLDSKGQLVAVIPSADAEELEINTLSWPNGLYFIKLYHISQVFIQKVQVE